MKKILLQLLLAFSIGIVGGIFGDQILWPYLVERPLFQQYRLEQNPVYVTEREEIFIQENTALQEAIDKVKDTVVGLTVTTGSGMVKGSGLILTADGLVLTLADLVPQGGEIDFFVQEEAVDFRILKRDYDNNLALVKIERNDLPTVEFANLDELRTGERIFLVGAPPREGEAVKMANQGIVKYFDEDFIHTSIFEATSLNGSCLFDIEGRFLGLNTIDYWGRVNAIPVDQVRDFVGF